MSAPVVVAITGASGAIYAVRLLEVLSASGVETHVTISESGAAVIRQELGLTLDLRKLDGDFAETYLREATGWKLKPVASTGERRSPIYHHHSNFFAPIASGSFLTAGMVVCPCSGGTLSGIAHGGSSNLIQRAADVHLKERRKLVLVSRETPLSVIQLENMHRVAQAGAIVLPAAPGWYHGVDSLADLVDFVVARILDQFAVKHTLMKRWGTA